jgi:hypothetical protein
MIEISDEMFEAVADKIIADQPCLEPDGLLEAVTLAVAPPWLCLVEHKGEVIAELLYHPITGDWSAYDLERDPA